MEGGNRRPCIVLRSVPDTPSLLRIPPRHLPTPCSLFLVPSTTVALRNPPPPPVLIHHAKRVFRALCFRVSLLSFVGHNVSTAFRRYMYCTRGCTSWTFHHNPLAINTRTHTYLIAAAAPPTICATAAGPAYEGTYIGVCCSCCVAASYTYIHSMPRVYHAKRLSLCSSSNFFRASRTFIFRAAVSVGPHTIQGRRTAPRQHTGLAAR